MRGRVVCGVRWAVSPMQARFEGGHWRARDSLPIGAKTDLDEGVHAAPPGVCSVEAWCAVADASMAALVSQAFRSSRRLRFGWPVASCRRDCSQQAWNLESGDMFVQATYAARAVSLPDLVQHVRSKW